MGFAMSSEYCDESQSAVRPSTGEATLFALSFEPPPSAESALAVKDMLGTRVPAKPSRARPATSPTQGGYEATSPASSVSCGRPGEPLNKVCLLLSSDLEGFLPYTLVISEELGLAFTSLTPAATFVLDPGSILKEGRLGHEDFLRDHFWNHLCRTIGSRPELSRGPPPVSLEERVRPPYVHLVLMWVRSESESEGTTSSTTVIMLLAVQSAALADELAKSVRILRKRRALRVGGTKEAWIPLRSTSDETT
ncbi:unnamed protein product [Polarella glacialis]|uniref:Uncharacterized protein n=1 Tax=Polarella glacialis TaxID=89957 RepID=A0A813FWP9_POLGL|nr:unnamed protein product [Polarella glacialis]